MRSTAIVPRSSLLAFPALAAESVPGINQTCAARTGCFAGDTPGFPVTIDGSAGHSSELTSDLGVSTSVGAISATATAISPDLIGFQIGGPGSYSATVDAAQRLVSTVSKSRALASAGSIRCVAEPSAVSRPVSVLRRAATCGKPT